VSTRDRLILVLLGAIWGGSFLFMRVAAPALGAVPLIAVRVGVAALFLLAALRVRGGDLAVLRPRWLEVALLGAVNTAVPFCLFADATRSLPAGFSSVLNATVPLFGALLGFLVFGDRLAARKVAGLAIGFAGVVALAWPRLSAPTERLAVLEGLAAAVLYAVAAHHAKRRFVGVPPLTLATGTTLAAALLVVPFAPFSWPEAAPSAASLACGVVLGVVCTGLAYALYFALLSRIGTARATTVTFLVPLFGVLWGVLFLGEPFTAARAVAGAVVVAGTALVVAGPAAGPR
jgi:drug/metabolite transporter (DMT)-like permease